MGDLCACGVSPHRESAQNPCGSPRGTLRKRQARPHGLSDSRCVCDRTCVLPEHLVDSPSIREPTFFSKGRARASLPGSLAASDALGSARSGFEATPVVDADHGVSES